MISRLYDQLADYTLSLRDEYFIHQLIVDTFAAQTFDKNTIPVKITFALVGLYLVNEKGFTGKQVQNVHIALSRKSKKWLTFPKPKEETTINIEDVLRVPDSQKQEMIKKWSQSVWEIWKGEKEIIAALLKQYMDI